MTYKLRSFVEAVSESETSPQTCPYDRFVGLEHYDPGELEITRYTDTSLLSSSVKVFHKNDILIARRNVYLKRAGIVFFDGLTSGDSIILRVLTDCEHLTGIPFHVALKWLPIVLNSSSFWAYANKHADGMNSKRISKEMLLEYEFSKLPLNEINDISSKVWAAHNLKNSYTKLLEATDEMVKSRFIEELYSRYPKQKLGEHISVIRGVSYKPSDVRSGNSETSTAIILRSNNITNGEINFDDLVFVVKERVQKEQELHKGDIVMCGSNGSISLVGKAGLLKTNRLNISFGAFCLGIKCKKTVLPEYLNTYFNTPVYREEIESMGNGTNIINIRPNNITNIMIPIPPSDKQKAFVDFVQQADKSKFELKQAIEKIDKVMRALMQ